MVVADWSLLGLPAAAEVVPFHLAHCFLQQSTWQVTRLPRLGLGRLHFRFPALQLSQTDGTVFMQKIFFEVYKQHQGEYMGSLLSAFFESMGSGVANDGDDDLDMYDSIDTGLAAAVNDNDAKFPPDFRLSKRNRDKRD